MSLRNVLISALILPWLGGQLLLVAAPAAGGKIPGPVEFDDSRYLEDVKYLSSDKLKGRGTGTPGLESAAEYIARQFRQMGLRPVNGEYYQKFPVTTAAQMGKHNKLTIQVAGKKFNLRPGDEFLPLNMSESGEVEGELVFVGYSITAPEYNYDDYEGLDVKGKIVVFFRREPQESQDKSPFNGRIYTRHAQFDQKALNAKFHGAKAAIVITDVLSSGYGELEKFTKTAGPNNVGIPYLMMKGEIAEELFKLAGKDLRETYNLIDQDLRPRSFAFRGSSTGLRADVRREVKQVRNVVGYLPGQSDEYVVIGAHYDHLGLGYQFSMAPSLAGKAHHGADDNASGTAGVLELARYFTSRPQPQRGILFMTFAGEELGLLGSNYFVEHPLFDLQKSVAMINMDMIGRVKENKLFLGGSGTGDSFRELLQGTPACCGLTVDSSETAGYGSSDHFSFTSKQVPVLFFFSGLHADYHKPSDTWDKINAPGAVNVLRYVSALTEKLLTATQRPKYVRVAPPSGAHAGSAASSSTGNSGANSGYGPYFGSIPDFAEPPKGVRFADVREGSPAAQGGLKPGDIMIGFAGQEVKNLYDFTFLLRQKKPGDKVEVKVLRGTEEVTVTVVLGQRK